MKSIIKRCGRILSVFLAVMLAFGTYGLAILGCAGGSKSIDQSASSPQKGVIYYHTDHLGSAHLITDSQGNILYEDVRYPYGLDRVVEGDGTTTADYVYTGKEYDEETGLIYFGARYYSPEMGRWISPDALFLEDEPDTVLEHPFSSNLYAYVRNNPVMYVDLDGNVENYIWYENRRESEWQYQANMKSGTQDPRVEMCYRGCGYIDMTPNSPEEELFQKTIGYSMGGMVGATAISGFYAVGPFVGAEAVSMGISNLNTIREVANGALGGFLAGFYDQRTGLVPNITLWNEYVTWVTSLAIEEISKVILNEVDNVQRNTNVKDKRGE